MIIVFSALCCVLLVRSSAPVPDERDFESRELYVLPGHGTFTPLQLSLSPQFVGSLVNYRTPVYGMSLGGMVHQQEITGVSIAGIHAFNRRKSGLSFSLIDLCNESHGVSFCAIGGAERNYGFAAGLWNLAEHNRGMQLGFINQVHPEAVIENEPGQKVPSQGFGVQAGLFNYSEGKGIQFGLWNTNPNAWLKHFPLINFAF